jgi:hypothetical protein
VYKIDDTKDNCYEEMNRVFVPVLEHCMEVFIADFTIKLGMGRHFKTISWNESICGGSGGISSSSSNSCSSSSSGGGVLLSLRTLHHP